MVKAWRPSSADLLPYPSVAPIGTAPPFRCRGDRVNVRCGAGGTNACWPSVLASDPGAFSRPFVHVTFETGLTRATACKRALSVVSLMDQRDLCIATLLRDRGGFTEEDWAVHLRYRHAARPGGGDIRKSTVPAL